MPPKPKPSKPAAPPPSPPTSTRRSKRLREQAITAGGEEIEVPAAKRAKSDDPAAPVKKGKKKQPKKKEVSKGKETVKAAVPKEPEVEEVAVEEKANETVKRGKSKTKPSPINTGNGIGAAGLPSQHPHLPPPFPSPYAVPTIPLSIPQTDTSTAALATAFAVHSALPRPPTTAWKAGHAFATWYRHTPLSEAAADTYTQQGKMATIPVVQAAWIGAYGQIVWEDAVSAARAMKGPGKANVPQMRRAVEVKRMGDADGEDVAFELIWRKVGGGAVRVNGREFGGVEGGGEVTVSALPDYAIIEIEDVVIFWFGKEEALDFVPEPKQKTGVSDAEILGEVDEPGVGEGEGMKKVEQSPNSLFDEDAQEEEEEETPAQPQPNETSLETAKAIALAIGFDTATKRKHSDAWAQIFHQNIHQHQAATLQSNPHQIMKTAMLDDQDVVLGIATVWQALREQGRHFAFNESANYQYARNVDLDANGKPMNVEIPPPVYRQHDLIIPLIIDKVMISPPNSAKPNLANEPIVTPSPPPPSLAKKKKKDSKGKEEEEEKGHTVFAVAKRIAEGAIHTIVMDSCVGYILPNRIRRSLRKTVCQNGWTSVDPATGFALPLDEEPLFTEEQLIVPHQEGKDTCGICTILNAWVYMLGLKPIGSTTRADYGGHSPLWSSLGFPEAARRVINLALRGHMDLLTIQAFLNAYGYCEIQDPDGEAVRLPAARTTLMTSNELNALMEPQRHIERTQEADRAAVVEETGCTYVEACLYLDDTDGNVGEAVKLYRVINRSSEAPRDDPAVP